MPDESLESIKKQLDATNPAQGQILAMVLSELKPNELQALRVQAAEGKLALELEQVRKVHQFHASSADIDAFIENIRQLEFAQKSSKYASYKATGTFETATGKTTIEARK